jgi:hypothetical protein
VTQCQEKDNNCPLMGVTTRQHSGAPKQVLTIRGSGWQQVRGGGGGGGAGRGGGGGGGGRGGGGWGGGGGVGSWCKPPPPPPPRNPL